MRVRFARTKKTEMQQQQQEQLWLNSFRDVAPSCGNATPQLVQQVTYAAFRRISAARQKASVLGRSGPAGLMLHLSRFTIFNFACSTNIRRLLVRLTVGMAKRGRLGKNGGGVYILAIFEWSCCTVSSRIFQERSFSFGRLVRRHKPHRRRKKKVQQ